MKVNEIMIYGGCPELEKIAQVRAHLAAIQRERRVREETTRRQRVEPVKHNLYLPNNFRG